MSGWRSRLPKLVGEVVELQNVFRLLAPYAAGHGRTLAKWLGITLLLLALRLAQPWPLKWIVDGLLGLGPYVLSPIGAGCAFLAIAAAAGFLEYRQVVGLVGLGNRILYRFRASLFQQVLRQPLAFHENRQEGELLTRIVYDTTRLRKGVNRILTHFLQTLLTFVATVLVLIWVDAVLAFVMGIAGSLAIYLMARDSRKVKKAARKNRKREGKLAALVAGELLSIRELQTYRPDVATSPAFERVNARSLKQEGKIQRVTSGLLFRVEVVVSAAVAGILFLGAERVSSGHLTAGELVLFVTYATALYRPFFQFARQSARLGSTLASADRLQRLMTREPKVTETPDAVDLQRSYGRIELSGVGVRVGRRRRGTRRWALRDVSVVIPAGERVAVVGPNGSGKSTLLRTVLRLSPCNAGVVTLDGEPLHHFTVASLRSRMSVVFQGSVFLGLSVRENLALGRPTASEDEILDALERVRALDLVERLPEGMDTVLEKGGALLSAGQRQRLAVARALVTNGDIWLLDEPTTSLDVEASEAVTRALLEATAGRTTLWVTHDPRLADRLDRALVLADGSVAYAGSGTRPEDTRETFSVFHSSATPIGEVP